MLRITYGLLLLSLLVASPLPAAEMPVDEAWRALPLAMLQRAMKVARSPEDKQWVLSRASTVRTLETLAWVAPFLDDAELSQAACQAIVELAHHRFLRHPNRDRFGPLLDKVARLSKDPAVAERAKKHRLGL
jgi:hypothetical protein